MPVVKADGGLDRRHGVQGGAIVAEEEFTTLSQGQCGEFVTAVGVNAALVDLIERPESVS